MSATKTFTVRLDIRGMSAAGGARWADCDIVDTDIASRGAREDLSEIWHVKARDSRSAIAKAEREIARSGVDGIRIDTCEER